MSLDEATLLGLQPAFRDMRTGETHLACDPDGEPCRVHSFDGVPRHWITEQDIDGRALALSHNVVPGYMRAGTFLRIGRTVTLPLDS